MGHQHRARHPKLSDLPHTSEMKKADGKPDLPKLLANVDEQVAALKSGKVELLDLDMSDPDSVTNEYYVIARCRVK